MCYFILVTCLIGVYFTPSATLLTVEHGLMSELKLNETVKEQTHKEKDVSDQYAITDTNLNMESILHNKHNSFSDEQAEHPKIKPNTFSMETSLNLFSVDIDKNEPAPLDGKDNQTNTSKNINEGYEDRLIDAKQQKEHKLESQESESNDQQSQRLSADGPSDHFGSFPLKPNTENVKHETVGNTEYANILEEIHDDEDLQYIFNITHNLDTMRQSLNNKTHNELYAEEPSPEDAIDMKDFEHASIVKEEDVNDNDTETSRNYGMITKGNLIKEENGVKTRIIVDDLLKKQKESATGEQRKQQLDSIVNTNKISGNVPDVNYSSEMTTNGQNDGKTDIAITALLTNLKNRSEVNVSHYVHDADADIQKKSLEISNMTLSTDPCVNFHCKRGKMCKTDGHGNPFCTCQDPDYCLPSNRNDLVCGTDNKTYTSACHLFGTKCHIEGTKEGIHLHLDYQGPCKYLPPCTEYEFAHFPFRMRDWLKNVLMQLYERDEENPGVLSDKQKSKVKKIYENDKRLQEGDHNIELLVKDFQKNYHMYVYPVHWQFHQLDQHVTDRLLTHSELAALRAPLIPNEHCVNAFLQKCNTNNDRHISLWEWCRCFGIKEGDIDEDLLF